MSLSFAQQLKQSKSVLSNQRKHLIVFNISFSEIKAKIKWIWDKKGEKFFGWIWRRSQKINYSWVNARLKGVMKFQSISFKNHKNFEEKNKRRKLEKV